MKPIEIEYMGQYLKIDITENTTAEEVVKIINHEWPGTARIGESIIKLVYKEASYALIYNGSGTYTLYKHASSGTASSIGNISTSSGFYSRPFVHPEDNILYIVIGNTIAKYDGTTFSTHTTILPSGFDTVSVTDYGSYLAIFMHPLS